LSSCITICPIGPVDGEILQRISACILIRCGLSCDVAEKMPLPSYAYDDIRHQYNSKTILKRLIKESSYHTLKFIGLTPVDLYVPILKFVFGLAQIEGKYSVVSLHRLAPQFYDQPPNPILLLERLEKTVLHELGHMFGITHCRNRHCIMFSSTRIQDTDFKNPCFCPTCFELLSWHLKQSIP
jgi:archaemetzincin